MKTVVPNVSLIIPVYNVEQYLPKCLESIAAQTLKGFEVILVDDGSTRSFPGNPAWICPQIS